MRVLNSYFGRITLIFTAVIFTSIAYSQNTNDAVRLAVPGLGSNARALGMGDSYIGLSDDASAAYFNPAGFGLLKRMEFSGGLDYTNAGNNTTFFNQKTNWSNSATALNNLSFAFPFPTMRGSLVFGLSYHETKDFTGALKFNGFNNGNNSLIQNLLSPPNPSDIPFQLYLAGPDNQTLIHGDLNQSGSILYKGALKNWTFSGAIEAYKNLFLGLNLNLITGDYNADNQYYEDDTRNIYGRVDPTDSIHTDFQTFNLNRVLNWDISGWNAKFGVLYQFNQLARLGFTVQFPKSYDIKEKFTVNGYSLFSNDQVNLNSADFSDQVEYNITTPFEFGVGFSVNLRGLIVSAQGTLVDYSETTFSDISGLGDATVNDINRNIKDQLAAVINYNVGAEYTIPMVGLRLRVGYLVQPSAYKGDPSKYDHKYLTGGIGFLADETIGIDLGYAYGWWQDFGDNYSYDQNGNYIPRASRTNQDITVNKFILTATYRF